MRLKIRSDSQLSRLVALSEPFLNVFRALFSNMYLDSKLWYLCWKRMSLLGGLENKIVNWCILTGCRRGIYWNFKLSRHMLKWEMVTGNMLGFSKGSW